MHRALEGFDRRSSINALFWLGLITVFCFSMSTHAQIAVAGYTQGSPVVEVKSRGGGHADIIVNGITTKATTKYCLSGVGSGNWFGKKVGRDWFFDLERTACGTLANGIVSVPVKVDNYQEKGRIIGYVPITLYADGKLADWQAYPEGSQKFEGGDGKTRDIIAVYFAPDGSARIATASEAATIND